jgi:hypothetical protein
LSSKKGYPSLVNGGTIYLLHSWREVMRLIKFLILVMVLSLSVMGCSSSKESSKESPEEIVKVEIPRMAEDEYLLKIYDVIEVHFEAMETVKAFIQTPELVSFSRKEVQEITDSLYEKIGVLNTNLRATHPPEKYQVEHDELITRAEHLKESINAIRKFTRTENQSLLETASEELKNVERYETTIKAFVLAVHTNLK